jgi:hypothetical protein
MRTDRSLARWDPEESSGVLKNQLFLMLAAVFIFLCGRWSVREHCVAPLGAGPAPRAVAAEVEPSLYEPPTGHAVVPVPSVVKDARGEIHNLMIGGARFNVLVSRAGTMRSGDVHRWPQLDLIFSGLVRLTTREGGKDVVRSYGSGDKIVIPPNIPHLFEFVNDTVMAEWWTGPFEARYYRPYRQRVDARTSEQRAAAEASPRRKLDARRARAKVKRPKLGKLWFGKVRRPTAARKSRPAPEGP